MTACSVLSATRLIPTSAAPPRAAAPSTNGASNGSRLASVERELQQRLLEEGLVVRAPDIARVVAVATGRTVEWP